MAPQIHSKLPDLETTIFTVVNKWANEHGAVNLSQGFPDFEAAPELLELVTKAIRKGYNQYAPMQGIYSLRETIAHKIEQLYGKAYHPETEITITAGATQALFTAISAFVKKDDEVIVLKPSYDCYDPAIELYGGIVVPVPLVLDNFSLNITKIKEAITKKTRMLIINTPHNPSGTILSEQNMLDIQALLRDTNIILLSDEVYEHIVFDGLAHESAAKFSDLSQRSLICASFGKTFHVTGWKMGYCVAPQHLMEEFQKVHQYNVFCVNHPLQRALNTYLQYSKNYLGISSFYQKKRDYFLNAIAPSRFIFTPCQGTFFQLLDYSKISDETDIQFVERLIKEFKIASIPISVFYTEGTHNRKIRFCFAKTEALIDQAAAMINKL